MAKSTISLGLKRLVNRFSRRTVMLHSTRIARQDQSCEKCAKLFFMSPKEQYSQRLAECNVRLARFDRLDARIGSIRLGIGASFLIIAWLCFGPLSIPRAWLGIPILGFIAMLVYHQRVRTLGFKGK